MTMILRRRAFSFTTNYLIKFSSTSSPLETILENKFTDAERQIILTTLNSSDVEELSRYNVAQARLKSLVTWKNKKGPFTSLSDILEVDGLGVNMVDKLCQSILSGDININVNKQKNKSVLTPILSQYDATCLTSAVGLHIETTGISWAKLQRNNNELVNWNYCDFSGLPKKISPIDTFNLTLKIMHSLPLADIYIFENKQSNGLNKSSSKIPVCSQQLELASMLLALINTSNRNVLQQKEGTASPCENKVYFMRHRVPARLFGALIGTERVSTEDTVLNIISGNTNATLPCSKVSVESKLVNDYCKCPKRSKDLLEQALLLVVSFMDLCVYNNPLSLKAIKRFIR